MTVPRPLEIRPTDGEFTLDPSTALSADPAFEPVARWLRGALGPAVGGSLLPGEGGISLRLVDGLAPESYRLTVASDGVRIEAGDQAGAFYGVQTLRQLLPPALLRTGRITEGPWTVPGVVVEDAPRFRWRGTMIDVARHFVPKAQLLRYVDLLALHKLNVLHLHLTDDQGWRLQINKYPRLTEVGGWRRRSMLGPKPTSEGYDEDPHGGIYTQDDIREIVAYAAERHVTVVPEIDLPGHMQAAIAAYPELGVTGVPVEVASDWGVSEHVLNVEESTVQFLRDVFDEVLELFPSEYTCVGGDECVKTQWRQDPRTQERMRELGVADELELQSWYIRQLDEYLTDRGRKLYGWDEILQGGLAEGAVVASWRGMSGAVEAARLGHEVVTCPVQSAYLDYRQADGPQEPIPVGFVVTVEDVYTFEPVPAELTEDEGRHVIGAQANIWTEHIHSARAMDYLAFPRLAAFAEVVWGPRERDYAEFAPRLDQHLRRLDALGVEYRPLCGPHPWQQRPSVPGWPRTPEDVMKNVFKHSA